MRAVIAIGICLLFTGAPIRASAQLAPDPGLRGRTHAGFGYVVSLPHQMLGFNAYVMSPSLRNWGVFADFKRNTETRREDVTFEPGMTAQDAQGFGDLLRRTESEWNSINAGVIRVMTPSLALYAGAGYSEEVVVRRYFDLALNRGTQGIYWVEDPEASGSRVNVMAGAWFRILPSFLVQFGVEAAPRGGTVGVSYVVPFGR